MSHYFVAISRFMFVALFGNENFKRALQVYRKRQGLSSLGGKRQRMAYLILASSETLFKTDRLLAIPNFTSSPNPVDESQIQVYDRDLLNLMTNRIFDMPDVLVDVNAPIRINILVPSFSISSISAGFFGVFNLAKFIQSHGFQVRLVLFDNFHYDEQKFKESLNNFPSFSDLFDTVEIEYIGERKLPLTVSPFDGNVATVWYSAYFAEKIQMAVNPKQPFLYLIQDYESAFHPFSSLNTFADQTYRMHYNALVSTEPLLDYMRQFSFSNGKKFVSFNNACSTVLPDFEAFRQKKAEQRNRFVFYSRPAVNRNMFELAALSIMKAFDEGVFGDASNWEFFGMGLGEVEIKLSPNVSITQLPRMSLQEYEGCMYTFDLCLSLMASPHPSIVPFDLASAGALVVTNSFETKNSDYFKNVSNNIFVAQPTISDIVTALREAALKVNDLDSRHAQARVVQHPNSWSSVWRNEHVELLFETFRGA